MRLDGIHHITGITGDGQRCLDFYAGILGLAFIGRERDFEAPGSHLIRLGQEPGRPGGVLNFIEAPGIGRGRAGNGMVHTLTWTVRFPDALSYWADRLEDAGIEAGPVEANGHGPRLRFSDPEGIEHELVTDVSEGDTGLALGSATIPPEHAIVGLAGVRGPTGARASRARTFSPAGWVSRSPAPTATRWRASVGRSVFVFDPPPRREGPCRHGHHPSHRLGMRRRPAGLAPAGDRHGVHGRRR